MSNNINARELALKVLYKIEKEKAYSNIALDEELTKYKLDNKDIGLASEIVYGVVTWKLTLDEIIKKYSKIKLKKISVWILNILRIGIYQIIFLDKIPDFGAVNECVKLAKRYGHSASSGFVNAVLRKVSKQDLEELNNIKDEKENIVVTTSHPVWLVEKLLKEFDSDFVKNMCRANNEKANLTARVNTLKISRDELVKILKSKGIECENGILENTIILKSLKNIANLREFKDGLFMIQDEAATLVSAILSPISNDIVLDACAAPGGKTANLAEIMNNKGKIIAWDLYEHRVKLVEENCARLGVDIIDCQAKDASIFDESLINKFDKILLDAPCSGLGVIRRKPDIKWQRTIEDIKQIRKIQIDILNNVSKYLKIGGYLVYSTCTILKEENEDVVLEFLSQNSDFELVNLTEKVPNELSDSVFDEKFIKLYPNKNNTDGFFICMMKKSCI